MRSRIVFFMNVFFSSLSLMDTDSAFIAPGSTLFRVLDGLADATNYLLLLWLLAVLIIGARSKLLTGRAWLAPLLSIAAVYVVKTIEGKFDLWERAGWNYSTHSALAAAVVMSLFFLDRSRRFIALAAFGIYEILIVLLGFHTIADIASTLLVIVPIAWLCHALLGREQRISAAEESGISA